MGEVFDCPSNCTETPAVLRVGYVDDRNFPFHYLGRYNRKHYGIFVDIWEAVAAARREKLEFIQASEYGGYTASNDSNSKFNGLLGLLQTGVIDGTAEEFSYKKSRTQLLYYTKPVIFATFQYYQRWDKTNDWDFGRILVFPASVLICFLFCLFFVYFLDLIEIAFIKRNCHASEFSLARVHILTRARPFSRKTMPSCFFNLGFFLFFVVYNAAFSGVAIRSISHMTTSISTFLTKMREGRSKLVLKQHSLLPPEALDEIFGDGPNSYEKSRLLEINDKQGIVNKICEDQTTFVYTPVFAGQPAFWYRRRLLELQCKMERINPPTVQEINLMRKSYPHLFEQYIGIEKQMGFFLPRTRKSKRIRDQLNQVLNLYDREKMEAKLLRSNSKRKILRINDELYSFDVVVLRNMFAPLAVLLALYLTSMIVLVCEIWVDKFQIKSEEKEL